MRIHFTTSFSVNLARKHYFIIKTLSYKFGVVNYSTNVLYGHSLMECFGKVPFVCQFENQSISSASHTSRVDFLGHYNFCATSSAFLHLQKLNSGLCQDTHTVETDLNPCPISL